MKIDVYKIVAHGDWDGVVGAGLLSRIYNLPLEFPLELPELTIENAVCIEITPGRVKSLLNSLIIDHHGSQPRQDTDEQGNQWILEPEYKAVSSLIADHWKLELPMEWRTAVEEVDTATLKTKLGTLIWKAFRVDAHGFPRKKVAEMVKKGNWKQLQEWAENRQTEYQKVDEKTKELIEKSKNLTPEVIYFTFRFNDRWERGASKDAMLKLEEKTRIVIAIGVVEKGVKSGTIATKKNIDLTKIYQHLRNQGYTSGGHKTVGGFQALKNKTLKQTLEDLRNSIKQFR
ncbi:MAG: DHHA1 domain-containing protein [Candidatus Lokiarchaeia archaeon]